MDEGREETRMSYNKEIGGKARGGGSEIFETYITRSKSTKILPSLCFSRAFWRFSLSAIRLLDVAPVLPWDNGMAIKAQRVLNDEDF